MTMNFWDDDIIEDYILQKLSVEDTKLFHKALLMDSKLQEEVDLKKKVLGLVNNMGNLLLYNEINKIAIEEDLHDERSMKATRKRLLYYISGAVAASLLIFIAYTINFQTPLNEDLFVMHYEAYEIDNLRGKTNENERIFLIATNYYQEKKYSEALTYYEKILNYNLEVQIAVGICYLETGDTISALKQFQALEKTPHKDMAIWYQALIHLRNNHLERSTILLEQLVAIKSIYAVKASKILQKLSN